MHTPLTSPARTARRLMAAVPLAALAALALSHTPASASSTGSQYGSVGQYGEVTRFGGFDTNAYDGDLYDKPLTSGEFLNPVGFAVDTADPTSGGDGTAIYVLDRVSDWAEYAGSSGTEWRLQKFDDAGHVLATTEFYLPKDVVGGARYEVFVGVTGLAVDDTTGNVYTVLYETAGTGAEATSYAAEILEWSTTPSGANLVAPKGAPEDLLSTEVSGYSKPGALSKASDLASHTVYDPQGLALDAYSGNDDIAIEGNAGKRSSGGTIQGPALVAQVSATTGAETGVTWSAGSLSGESNASSEDASGLAAGISDDPSAGGELNVLLAPSSSGSEPLTAVNVSPDLSSQTVISSSALTPSSEAAAPLLAGYSTGSLGLAGGGLASAQAVTLSNGLYASDYFTNDGLPSDYWVNSHNEGIRLVQPLSGGLLSNSTAPPTSIFDTLGNVEQTGACYIGEEGKNPQIRNTVTLAAGKNGAVWALTSGVDSSDWEGDPSQQSRYTSGREVIELAPDQGTACAGPSGTFSFGKDGSNNEQEASGQLAVTVGSTVDFDASTIHYPTTAGPEALAYAYEWDTGTGTTIVEDTPSGVLVPPTAKFTYSTPGLYNVKLKLLGDFGEYDEAGTVLVQTVSPPTASFTAPASAQTNQSVAFDASASQPASGAQISNYHWSFGDGTSDDTPSPTDSHIYAQPGTYTVTLTVRDNDNQQSQSVAQQITVSAAAGKTGGGGTTTTTTTTTGSPPAVTADRSATNVSPKALAAKGAVTVTVTCPASKVSCAGTIQVKTASAVAAASKAKKKTKKTVLVLGTKSFSLAGGKKETLTVSVSAKGLALLKKSKHLKVLVVVSAHDSYGDPSSKTLSLTLNAPAKKSGKKK